MLQQTSTPNHIIEQANDKSNVISDENQLNNKEMQERTVIAKLIDKGFALSAWKDMNLSELNCAIEMMERQDRRTPKKNVLKAKHWSFSQPEGTAETVYEVKYELELPATIPANVINRIIRSKGFNYPHEIKHSLRNNERTTGVKQKSVKRTLEFIIRTSTKPANTTEFQEDFNKEAGKRICKMKSKHRACKFAATVLYGITEWMERIISDLTYQSVRLMRKSVLEQETFLNRYVNTD